MIDVDLFAGAGGLAVGLTVADFSPVHFFEIDPPSCQTLRHNATGGKATLNGLVHEENVERIDWRCVREPVRLLAAGAPCQPFSLGGKHRAEHDGRNLFPEVVRAVRELGPEIILLENVRGLLRKGFRPYFEYVLRQLEFPALKPKPQELWQNHDERIRQHQCSVGYEPDYFVTWRLVDAADYGVPQNRQRVFIVATRTDLLVYKFPRPTHSRQALLRVQLSGEYWERHGIPKPKRLPSNGVTRQDDGDGLPWVTVRDGLKGLPEPASQEVRASMNAAAEPAAKEPRLGQETQIGSAPAAG